MIRYLLLLVLPFVCAFPGPLPAADGERIPVLLISGANNHDWEWTHRSLRDMLAASGRFDVTVTLEPGKTLADPEGLKRYRAFVLDYNGPRWGNAAERCFLEAVRDGGVGVSIIHAANNAFPGWVEYEKLVGLMWRDGTGHGRFHSFSVEMTDRDHPITRGLADMKSHHDELYHRLVHMHDAELRVLASAMSSKESGGTGEREPMVIVSEYGRGRVFHTPLGHVWRGDTTSRQSHLDPQFRNLVVRGTEWAATGDVTEMVAAEDGWQTLFDGTSTHGWRGFKKDDFPAQGWKIDGDALRVVAKGGGGDLITEAKFADFELELEWKVAAGANSGIIYRVSEDKDTTWRTGPEYQIFDDGDLPPDGNTTAGALYALYSPRHKSLKPVGEYNHARIIVCDDRVQHWLNGFKVVDARLHSDDWKQRVAASKFSKMPAFGAKNSGHIALQDHGNDVWFRNIRVREIGAGERARYDADPVALFNGQDLSGWTHHLKGEGAMADVWRVDDGVIICKGEPAGYIRTEADYTSFVLNLDWRFSPVTKKAGNSGVLFRMVGEDKVWPKSIEAQLMSGRAGDFWAIGEYPMETDPARRNGRNTRHTHANENPVGEWNHYEIIVDGGDVTLKVNGEVLNRAENCMVTPGKICLQSEGVEIQFRNIELTPLPERTATPDRL